MSDLKQTLGYVDEKAFADLRDISLPGLRNERARGHGPAFVRVGRTVMYSITEIDAYLKRNTIRPESAPTMIDGAPRRDRKARSGAAERGGGRAA